MEPPVPPWTPFSWIPPEWGSGAWNEAAGSHMAHGIRWDIARGMPVVCGNSSVELLRKFKYGVGSDVMTGAYHPATGLGKYVSSTSPEHNLNLAFRLANRDLPNFHSYFVSADPKYKSWYQSCIPAERIFINPAQRRVPYDIEFASDYKFNASRCGYFGRNQNRWRWVPDPCAKVDAEVNTRLCDPKCTVLNTACHPAGLLTPEDGGSASKMKNGEQRKYWDPATICPDWRRMCGAQYPPNLPAELRKIELDRDHVWLQVFSPHGGSLRACAFYVSEDQLPPPEMEGMQWQVVHTDSPLCRARNLEEAFEMKHYGSAPISPTATSGGSNPASPLRTHNSSAVCNPAQFERVTVRENEWLRHPGQKIRVFRWGADHMLYYNGTRVPASYAHATPDDVPDDAELYPVANNLRLLFDQIKPEEPNRKSTPPNRKSTFLNRKSTHRNRTRQRVHSTDQSG